MDGGEPGAIRRGVARIQPASGRTQNHKVSELARPVPRKNLKFDNQPFVRRNTAGTDVTVNLGKTL